MSPARRGLHLATLAHDGRLWDAYVELDDDPQRPDSYRGRLRFDSPDVVGSVRTAVIFIEPSYEDLVTRARGLDARQMQGLLRSVLPEVSEESGDEPASGEDPA
ncbi:MAG TPA: hypothetical protein VJ997_11610 [Longimicrobiales bacterium]|nr:hypothetical protein [Longimicrobiales bacterium]